MPIVTIAGEYGSGGRELGQEAARLVGAEFIDREIIAQAARRLKAKEEAVAERDMRPQSRGQRLSRVVQSLLEKSAIGAVGDPLMGPSGLEYVLTRTYQEAEVEKSEVTDRHYMEAVQAVIQDLAREGNVVIIRRGGQFILKDRPEILHVCVVCSWEERMKRVMGREGLEQKAAVKLLEDSDRNRTAYFKKFYKANVKDPVHYHLVLNTSKMPIAEAARLVADAATVVARKARGEYA